MHGSMAACSNGSMAACTKTMHKCTKIEQNAPKQCNPIGIDIAAYE
jgi:hypothetical protein